MVVRVDDDRNIPFKERSESFSMSDATSFDVVPTEDGAGYWVKICSEERCCQAFVSSMHMADGKRPQLLSCLHDGPMTTN
ncbi:hypothetical protein SynBOUM118_01404 [Synechococcus sp. BOUM118]|nr:hypothetical protein SynBOUM118_01404 [Synechococcus sp. BOUM118]